MAKEVYFTLFILAVGATVDAVSEDFVTSANTFSHELYGRVVDDHSNQNIIMSPLSIHTVLAMTYMGAGGETANEMSRSLRLDTDLNELSSSFKEILDNTDENALKIANKIYLQEGFQVKSEFDDIVRNKFSSEVENINFANKENAASTINNWVKEATEDKIQNLIDPSVLSGATKCVLVNGVHFKASWKNQFKKRKTVKDNFWLNENQNKQVDMMNGQLTVQYFASRIWNFTSINIPYTGDKYSMLIILPKEKTGLRSVEQSIVNMPAAALLRLSRISKINVKLPKFRTEFSASLVPVLQKMGMTKMFTSEANFSNLTPSANIAVSDVVHKAFIDVNEEGTEAAAATSVRNVLTGFSGMKEFLVDRPFLYLIVDQDGTIYFMGRVVDP